MNRLKGFHGSDRVPEPPGRGEADSEAHAICQRAGTPSLYRIV